MPVPPGFLMDIAVLIVREYWRSRRRRTAPAIARAHAPSKTSVRRLSPVERVLRLAVIAGVLWLIWREVARRRAALIEARRASFRRTATPPATSPTIPPALAEPAPASGDAAPATSPVAPPALAEPAPASGDAAPATSPVAPPALAESAPASGNATPAAPPVESAESAASATDADDSPSAEHAAPEDAPDGEETRNGALIGWCARCRARHPMQQTTVETNTGGRSIARGICPVCGAGITRFISREQMTLLIARRREDTGLKG